MPKKYNTKSFIKKAKQVHGDRYDYSKVEYKNCKTKICIICPEHGEFWQTPSNHLKGGGCQKCAREEGTVKMILPKKEFIIRGNKIHNNKYDYSKVEYTSLKQKVCIICPEHGEFWQTPDSHLHGAGCKRCTVGISKKENEIFEYVINLLKNINVEQSNRTIIKPHELDIYIPEMKIGIEYNGLLWHSDKYKDSKNYHLDKLNDCKKQGIRLIQIFEDEYINHKDIVYEKIKHILGCDKNKPKIMARKCVVKEIDCKTSSEFLEKYHIQGSSNATIRLGCYYNDELIAVMTFLKEKKGYYELNRFASDYNYICQGIGGKLFKYFIKNYNSIEVKSFADRRWTVDENNNLYTKLGFVLDKIIPPDYKYYKSNCNVVRIHKFNFRKQILHKKYNLPLSMTEKEMTEKLGYYRVYDCGLLKYVWKNGTTSKENN